jgi:hypothetical protein
MKGRSTLLLLAAAAILGGFILLVERRSESTERRQETAKRAFRFDPEKISLLRVVRENLDVSCEKRDGRWVMTAPVKAKADAGRISRLLETLASLTRSQIITAREMSRKKLDSFSYGLDQPRAKIVLGGDQRSSTILVGRDAPLGDSLYVQMEGRKEVLATATNLLSELPQTGNDLRDRSLFEGVPGDVQRIEVRRSEGVLQLARTEQGAWTMQNPVVSRAGTKEVVALLEGLYDVRIEEFVADSFAAAALYGLDEPAAQVALFSDRKPGEQALLLGKPLESDTNRIYATMPGIEAVYAIDRAALIRLNAKADDFRDRRLLPLSSYEIRYVSVEKGERTLKLVQEDGAWKVTEPRQHGARPDRVQLILDEWTGARIEQFNDQPGTNLAAYGLAPPAMKLVLARRPPSPAPTGTVEAASAPAAPSPEGEAVVLIGGPDQPGRRFVKLQSEERVYVIEDAPLAALDLSPLTYRDPVILRLATNEFVKGLTIAREGVEESVEREGTNAFAAVKAAGAIESGTVSDLLTEVSAFRVGDYIAEDPQDLKRYGLDAPAFSITARLSGGSGISKSILFGGDAGPDAVYAMIQGLDVVFTVEKTRRDRMLRPLVRKLAEPAGKE